METKGFKRGDLVGVTWTNMWGPMKIGVVEVDQSTNINVQVLEIGTGNRIYADPKGTKRVEIESFNLGS